MAESQTAATGDEWMDLGDAAAALGFDPVTLLRLIQDGDFPAIQIRGAKRTAHRVPRALVKAARAVVFAGGQVELREFARRWAAASVEAVA